MYDCGWYADGRHAAALSRYESDRHGWVPVQIGGPGIGRPVLAGLQKRFDEVKREYLRLSTIERYSVTCA
jgi:hypothetical protein